MGESQHIPPDSLGYVWPDKSRFIGNYDHGDKCFLGGAQIVELGG